MKDSSEAIDQLAVRVRNQTRKFLAWSETTTTRLPEIAVLVVVAASLLYLTRNSWFFGDDWAFLVGRRGVWVSGHHFEAIFHPHNEHLYALQVAVYLIVESVFGLGTAVPYFAILVAGHVVVLWAVRTIMVRLDVPLGGRLVGLLWLGFFGAGAENLIWPFQMGFIWAFALSLWGLLVLTGGRMPSLRRDLCASALFTSGLFTASTALPVVFVAVVAMFVMSRSVVRLLRVFAIPLALYGTWYVLYGKSRMPHNPISSTQIVPYLTKGISFGFDQTFQFVAIGLILGFLALILIASLSWFTAEQRRITAVLAATLVVFYLVSAVGRAFLGAEAATAPRYVYFCGVLSIPFIVLAFWTVLKRVSKVLPILGFVLVIAVVGNAGQLLSMKNDRMAATNEWKWRFAVAAAHVMSPLADLGVVPDARFNPDVSLAGIRSLRDGGIWSYEVPLSPQQLLEGSVQFGTRVYATPPDAKSQSYKAVISGVDGVSLVASSSGCLLVHPTSSSPTVTLEAHQPGTFSLDTGGAASALHLQMDNLPAVRTASKSLNTSEVAGPVWVGVYPVFGQPVIELPSDVETTLCGLERQ